MFFVIKTSAKKQTTHYIYLAQNHKNQETGKHEQVIIHKIGKFEKVAKKEINEILNAYVDTKLPFCINCYTLDNLTIHKNQIVCQSCREKEEKGKIKIEENEKFKPQEFHY